MGVLVGSGVGVAVAVEVGVSVGVAAGTSLDDAAVGEGATGTVVSVAVGPGAGVAQPASSTPSIAVAAIVFLTADVLLSFRLVSSPCPENEEMGT